MTNLLKRGISGLIYSVLFISAIVYSKESYTILIVIFGYVCIWEFLKLINFKNIFPYFLFTGLSSIPFLSFDFTFAIKIVLAFSILGSLSLIINLYSKKQHHISNIFQKLFITFKYLLFPLFFLLILPIVNGTYQYSIILSLVIFIWVNDSFAFLVGKNFGKRKLFETISPKKTIEGFIGGMFFTIISGIILSYFIDFLSMTHWVTIAIIVSVLGTIGDLVESKFKRQANIKDSGTIMPGHGGLLDRLDSLLFVAPFVYLYIHFLIF